MDRKIKVKTINGYITCQICKGYLIGATAITECLHTFCKSCLIKHLEGNTSCPTCLITIHHSYPRQYIKFDRTLQDIVYKVVPALQQNEHKREKEFYQKRGLPWPIDVSSSFDEETTTGELPSPDVHTTRYYPDNDELITLCLESMINVDSKNKYIRVASKVTVKHLKKFIACKILNQIDLFGDLLEIYCNCELLDKTDTLKYVYLTKWRAKDVPLVLQYKQKYL